MNPHQRQEFDQPLAVLCAGFDVPCTPERQEAYWIALQGMQLGNFTRTVPLLLQEEGATRLPKPAAIWAASKKLRAQGPEKPVDDGFRGDHWDQAANRH